MAGEDQKIYLADQRMAKVQQFIELDSINRIRNVKCFESKTLAVIDDESLFMLEPRKGELMSMVVHNMGRVTRRCAGNGRHHRFRLSQGSAGRQVRVEQPDQVSLGLTLSSLDFSILGEKCFIPKDESVLLFDIGGFPSMDDNLDFHLEHPVLSMKADLRNNLIFIVDITGKLHLIST